MKVKILYIISGRSFYSYKPGRKISSIVRCWENAGYDVKCIFGGDLRLISDAKIQSVGGNSYGHASYYNTWYRKISLLKPIINTVSEFRDIQHDIKLKRRLRSLIEEWKPDLIWERSCRLHVSGINVAQSYNIPYVLEWKDHLLDYGFSLFKSYAVYVENRKKQLSKNIIIESTILKNQLIKSNVDRQKILVALNAVEKSEFNDQAIKESQLIRQKLNISTEEIVIGYMGSYAFYHDAERLVSTAKLLETKNLPIKFLLIGSGKHYQDCLSLAESLNLDKSYLIFHPPVAAKEVPSYLGVFNIAVLPGSTNIICPIKVQEYMAAGLPVVVPDYECNREVVTDGGVGSFFEPFNEESLASALQTLIKNESLRLRMGQAGISLAEEKFSWEATWGKTLRAAVTDAL